jgi:hypothetical protein
MNNIMVSGLFAMLSCVAGAVPVQAAFTAMEDGHYRMVITSGCFQFGSNCQTSRFGQLADNATQDEANAAASGHPYYGSGITNDGLMGVIDFTLTGGSMSVKYFSQDSYLYTPAGTIYLHSGNNASMGGSIDALGNMVFDPTGRQAYWSLFSSLGENEWNRDDPSYVSGGTGLYSHWTTGSSVNGQVGPTPGFVMTGSALQDVGVGIWAGTLVSAGNVGQAWGSFDGTQYSELFNVQIMATSPVPVPAALWLLGSGLLLLIASARRGLGQ